MSQVAVRPPAGADRQSGGRRKGVEAWSAGRLARVVTMLFVAAIFVFPIVGFIAMAFRSNDVLHALNGTGGLPGVIGCSNRKNSISGWV